MFRFGLLAYLPGAFSPSLLARLLLTKSTVYLLFPTLRNLLNENSNACAFSQFALLVVKLKEAQSS